MKLFRQLLGYFLALGLFGVIALTALNWQSIYDWYRLRDYDPPTNIAALAENTAMTARGQRLFYVHYPQLEDAESFSRNCSFEEQTIVLGCYITHQSIHIFDVKDERLQGIREVTAAHEMLHAAYDRLSSSEKERIDALTSQTYESVKSDNERLRTVIDSYARRDPSVVANELHSILATELRNVPQELEEYYAQYFTDRTAVVNYSEQYEEVFGQQQKTIQSLRDQISELEDDLRNRRGVIDTQEADLRAEAEQLNRLRNADEIAAYNSAIPDYNQKVNAYRSDIERFNADVQRLNDLIGEFNQLAVEQKELYEAIDSRPEQL